ncbi:MAG: hypothetical protein FIA99_15100 [Ruminiclostridium sp.]|nr:hypothetical protein [Ruminiclostridium sp.]
MNITKYHKEQFTLKSRLSARQEEMKIAGTMLYWGEGTKGGNSVVFSNSDAEMVRVFLKFLRTICGISNSRLRVVLHHYKDQNEYQLKQFWSKKTLIPLSQFSKSYLHRLQKGSYKRISQFGTLSVRYSDKKLLEIINSWIKDCARHL